MISILIPSDGDILSFEQSINRLSETCSNKKLVEIVFKLDTDKFLDKYVSICLKNGFKYNYAIDDISGYMFIGHFCNLMAKKASGDIFFLWADDFYITGDWVSAFMLTRNVCSDNIYAINTRNHVWTPCPAITKEWYAVTGHIIPKITFEYGSGYPPADTWIQLVAGKIGRYFHFNKNSNVQVEHRSTTSFINAVSKRLVRKMYLESANEADLLRKAIL